MIPICAGIKTTHALCSVFSDTQWNHVLFCGQ